MNPSPTPPTPRPKRAKPPKRQATSRHAPQYVLLLTDTGTLLTDHKGHTQPIDPTTLPTLKLRGTVFVLDLTDLTDTTYVPTPGLTPQQATSAITLSPEQYLPAHLADEAIINVLPTTNDEGEAAALISYAATPPLQTFTTQLSKAGLKLLGIEPAALTALHRLPTQGGAAVITSTQHQHIALIVKDAQVIGRIRQPAVQDISERVDQLFELLSACATILHNQQLLLKHVTLIADPESAQRLHTEFTQGTPDVTLEVLTQADLAQLGFLPPILLLKPGKSTGTTPRGDLKAYLPLFIGLAIGLVPFLTLTLLNQMTQRQITGDQVALDTLAGPLHEYTALTTKIAGIRTAQQQVNTIRGSRVNWPTKLAALINNLPTQNGTFAVQLQTLQATATQPPPPPPPADSTTAAGTPAAGTPTADTPVPVSAPITLPAPTITYTLTAQATNKSSMTTAINTLESRYILNLTNLKRTLPTSTQAGVWVMQATATEKPTPQGAAQ